MKLLPESIDLTKRKHVLRLQEILAYVGEKIADPHEVAFRSAGPQTLKALNRVRKKMDIPPSTQLDKATIELLNQKAIEKYYSTKTQITRLHNTLMKSARIAGVGCTLSDDLRSREFGQQTNAAIRAFQEKYKLRATGQLNRETIERLQSVTASRAIPARKLKVPSTERLMKIRNPIRLNMRKSRVGDLQRALAWAGYSIDRNEFSTQMYGNTTRKAVIEFQTQHGLPVTGNVGWKTSTKLNSIIKGNSLMVTCKDKYRVRGTVRDELWRGVKLMTVRIYERRLRDDVLLAERKTLSNGFYDVQYTPPYNSLTGKPKETFQLHIKVLDAGNTVIHEKTFQVTGKVLWANFTKGNERYRGESHFVVLDKMLKKALGAGSSIAALEESNLHKDVSFLRKETVLAAEDIMKMTLSYRVSAFVNQPVLTPEVFYAFIRQNLPHTIPGDLLPDRPEEWNAWIHSLVEGTTDGIAFLDSTHKEEALWSALKLNYVSRTIAKELPGILDALESLGTNHILEKPMLDGNGTVKSLLSLSSFKSAQYHVIADCLRKARGFTSGFFEALKTVDGITAAAQADFQTIVALGAIASSHMPTVSFLKNKLAAKNIKQFKTVSDFAKLSLEEWSDLISENGNQVPAWINGNTLSEKKAAYAELLKKTAEQQYPAISFLADANRSNKHALGNLDNILKAVESATAYELKKDNVGILLKTAAGLNNHEVVALKVLQRVHRIAKSAAAGVALLECGLYSAAQVYYKGKEYVVQVLQSKVSKAEAIEIYHTCANHYFAINALLTEYRFDFHLTDPGAVLSRIYSPKEIEKLKETIPDIETLFGPLDIREVKHCESVLGPSAYLTDLFRFLDQKPSKVAGKTVKDILFGRRPDLGNIKLNCQNTNTSMPYIDLVCEILENRLIDGAGSLHFQSTWPSEDLIAEPEHLEAQAYDTLKDQDFPIFSCFNLWQEETRAFLEHLGIPRHHLMRTFLVDATPAVAKKNRFLIAAEYFGISPQEQPIITTPRPTNPWQKKYWSNQAAGSAVPVSVFLQKSGLTYRQLTDLLSCAFVNAQSPKSTILCPIDNCALEAQKLQDMSLDRLDRMNRFIRLWKKTGLTMRELDVLLSVPFIGQGKIDKDTVIQLHTFERLRAVLKLGVEEFAGFFGPLNTKAIHSIETDGNREKNIYERIFLTGSLDNKVYTDFSKLLTSAATTEPLSQHKTHLLSSLSLRNEDLDLLLPLTDQTLTLTSLSTLFRYTTLSRRLRISLRDLFLFLGLAGISNPFASMETVETILEQKTFLQASGISLPELAYIVTHTDDSPVGLRDKAYMQKIQTLRESLVRLQDKIAESDRAGEDSLAMLLGMIDTFAEKPAVTTAMGIIAGTWSATSTEKEAFITASMGVFLSDVNTAIATLAYSGPVNEAAYAARRSYVMTELLNYFNKTTVKECIAVAFGIDSSHAETALRHLHLPGKTESLLTVLQDPKLHSKNSIGEYQYETTKTALPDIFSALQLLHKASVVIHCLKLDPAEFKWFLMHHSPLKTIDFNTLPVYTAQTPLDVASLIRLYRFVTFRRHFPEPEHASFFAVLDLAMDGSQPAQTINDELCKITAWNAVEHALLHHAKLDYLSPVTYEWFLECHRQKKVTGADFQSLFSWARSDEAALEEAKARKVREMVKAKYERAQWLAVSKSIQDKLRETKRAALTAYLMERSQRTKTPEITLSNGQKIKNPEYWTSPHDLYGWFLIDVEMCSEQLTSRMKQAISSMQLFIQRCFLNLESREVEVAQPDPDIENSWLQWKWMKNYRIWEANRKVFLYPENWIEPELRDNKSPFFEELESDILSREATNENVEAALQRYIQKLEEVAHVEVCSIFHEKDGPTDLLHVIARTRNMPPAYFYRNYDLTYCRWSPWEKIETEIHSDHVVPYVYNRKLHIFWLIFLDKPIKLKNLPPVKQSDTPTMNPEPAKLWEIELGWIVRQADGWDTKKISKHKLIHPWERPAFSYTMIPRYRSSDNALYLDLYISTSKEFNDNTFYDQFSHSKIRLSSVGYDERLRPWHSSSFVFTGTVKEILLRGIPGYYFSAEAGAMRNMTSYEYVRDNFGDEGNSIAELKVTAEQLALPSGMHFKYTRLSNNRRHAVNDHAVNVFGTDKGTRTLFTGGQNPFQVVLCSQGLGPVEGKIRPLFYQDAVRSFFVMQDKNDRLWNYQATSEEKLFSVYPFYHPFAEVFQQEINRGGVERLYQRNLQLHPESYAHKGGFSFITTYKPAADVQHAYAETEELDFTRSGAYSLYNWELFFHAPFMIACRLSQNQRFEEAMHWFHYIFDPTNTGLFPTPQRFWITKPFHTTSDETYRQQRISHIIEHIDAFKAQMIEWKNHPFKPHLIAEYRTVAYQKTVVMKYLDNLIAWGDQLFRRDTLESINEATLLYVLAFELLGRRPVIVPALQRKDKTYNELATEGSLDTFGNTKVEINLENTLNLPITYTLSEATAYEQPPSLEISYYGIPHNDKLLNYWDTVEDRLFKIRHGLNIEGLKRQLPLFEPPIDPALLVKAAVAGLDLAAVLGDLNAPAQSYRFTVLASKAVEFCNDVKDLGRHLLTALEKRDAEDLSVLRASHEVTLLEAMRAIRKLRIDELDHDILSFERRKDACRIRIDHVKSLSVPLEAEEQAGKWSTAADVLKVLGRISTGAAAFFAPAPDAQVGANGAGGSPKATVKAGGSNVVKAFKYTGKALEIAAEICKWRKDSLASEAKSQRTKVEREAKIAAEEKEMDNLERQRLAREIVKQIAEKELDNYEKEVEVRKVEQEYLQNKYTNEQLYQWMISQVSTVYFQAYQLAYDMAKRAEKSYRRELGQTDTRFIQFGYWDSLKKGLLSADRLAYDIRRMESSYLDCHKRELEITKHASLARLAPEKFLELKLTGRCFLDIEEWMYNLDYPGHYRRRIKSVSVSVPCQADDYTNLNCRLTLQQSEIRISNLVGSGYAKTGDEDIRFLMQPASGESIATSHGKYDNGLFVLSFNDDRFLPFEGAGAISSWDIHMPLEHNQFDYSTMTDFIMHISYTAQEGGETLAASAKTELDQILPDKGMLIVGLKYLFPMQWDAFLTPETPGTEQKLTCTISANAYPFRARRHEVDITKVGLVIAGAHTGSYHARVSIPGQSDIDCTLEKDSSLNNVHYKPDVFEGTAPSTGDFSIMVRRDTAGSSDFTSLPHDDIDDMYLLLYYA